MCTDITTATPTIDSITTDSGASASDRITNDTTLTFTGTAEVGGVVELAEETWDRVMDVNLKSAFLTMKHVIPVMEKQGAGSIINISSIAAIRYTGVPYATYYASKAALGQPTTFRELCEKFVQLDESTRAKPNADHKDLYTELLTRQGDLTRRLEAADYL
mgnify:CR=1 FL=1